MEATTPELGPVGFWSPKSAVAPRRSCKKLRPGAPNFFVQHDKVEDSKLRRYLETCGRALEQFLQRQTSSNDSIVFWHSTDW